MSENNPIILKKIIKYCEDIANMINGVSFDAYIGDIKIQYACGMCIIQIGELISRLSEDFIRENKIVPWRAIRAMRNIYAHDYEKTDHDTVWVTLTEDIPALKAQLQQILADMQN